MIISDREGKQKRKEIAVTRIMPNPNDTVSDISGGESHNKRAKLCSSNVGTTTAAKGSKVNERGRGLSASE